MTAAFCSERHCGSAPLQRVRVPDPPVWREHLLGVAALFSWRFLLSHDFLFSPTVCFLLHMHAHAHTSFFGLVLLIKHWSCSLQTEKSGRSLWQLVYHYVRVTTRFLEWTKGLMGVKKKIHLYEDAFALLSVVLLCIFVFIWLQWKLIWLISDFLEPEQIL